MNKILTFVAAVAIALPAVAQTATQAEVLDAARNANDYFMAKYADPTEPTNVKKIRPSSLWTRAVYYEGLMALYGIDPKNEYIDYTDRWAAFHKWTPRDGTSTRDADNQCCSQTYLDRFVMTGDSAMMRPTMENIRGQMAETKLGYWTWIDAIQMAMPVYAQMYKITGDKAYIDHAMDMYRWSRNECGGGLFNEADGLWWRDADYVPPYKEKDGKQCYWSRGNGWIVVAMARMLDLLPEDEKHRKEYETMLVSMCKALKPLQREDGFWNVSLHDPSNYGGKELSGTAMFIYGMAYGVNHGLLDAAEFSPVIYKAWNAMVKDCLHPNGFLGYVQGTGKEPKEAQPVTYDREPDFDDFGLGAFLMAGSEITKMK